MKHLAVVSVLALVFLASLLFYSSRREAAAMEKMTLTSTAFAHNQTIPSRFTCDGANVSPPLALGHVPAPAKSLVLIVDDPDAPSGDWVHWVLYNIDPTTTAIDEGGVPHGAVGGTNDFMKTSFGGPCPPSGTHRYFFKLYALDEKLPLGGGARKQEVVAAMKGHIIATAELVGLYRRR